MVSEGGLAADLGDLSGVISLFFFSIPQNPFVSRKAENANKWLLSLPALFLLKKIINQKLWREDDYAITLEKAGSDPPKMLSCYCRNQ